MSFLRCVRNVLQNIHKMTTRIKVLGLKKKQQKPNQQTWRNKNPPEKALICSCQTALSSLKPPQVRFLHRAYNQETKFLGLYRFTELECTKSGLACSQLRMHLLGHSQQEGNLVIKILLFNQAITLCKSFGAP